MSGLSFTLAFLLLTACAALALGMDKHWRQVREGELTTGRRRVLRTVGWVLLAAALAVGVVGWGESVGIVAWLGWLSVAGLAFVFSLPKFSRESERPEKAPRAIPASFVTAGSRRVGQWVAGVGLLATPVLFAWGLHAEDTRPLLRDDVLSGEVGPWSFKFAEAEREGPELVTMDIPVKGFQIRFCDACDREIRSVYLKVNKPRSARTFGSGFTGARRERSIEIQLPSTLTGDSELWLTVEGKDGVVHQTSWPMAEVSPATVAWFDKRKGK
ncbi:DUF3325 domain-containing protein [Steroidobacter sp.]|uniref:DUF3325 domain-containing protein n=1 Tax=Steroidobacter sp. TaxID=1978227 RepID=UPI001A39537E|nr:DUF3325 domain-containing protein [Steroidobacter sp.]MBL8269674.1 DUF3325 domain-containing protein [Steroidobacter sp.]